MSTAISPWMHQFSSDHWWVMGDRLGIQVAVDIAFWDRARSGVSVMITSGGLVLFRCLKLTKKNVTILNFLKTLQRFLNSYSSGPSYRTALSLMSKCLHWTGEDDGLFTLNVEMMITSGGLVLFRCLKLTKKNVTILKIVARFLTPQ